MSSLKPDMYALCKEVATEFENWSFVGDVFKNKTLKHTDLIVSPGFSFQGSEKPSCSIDPAVFINNKTSMALAKRILGYQRSTSLITFPTVRNLLLHYPQNLRIQGRVYQYREPQLMVGFNKFEAWPESWIGFDEARPVIKAMLLDGITLIEQYYDLSSEENLLRALPPKYVPAMGDNEAMELQQGIMVCIARIMIGDFDFVEYYRSDAFKTGRPKRIADLDKIIAALPELKQRYAETGKVI